MGSRVGQIEVILPTKSQLRIQFGVLPPYQNAKIRDLAQGSGR